MQEKPPTPHTGRDLQSPLVMCMIHSSSMTGCVWSLCPSNCLTRQTCTLNAHRCQVKYTDYLKTTCTGWDSHRARWSMQCYFVQNHACLAIYHNSGLIINTSFFNRIRKGECKMFEKNSMIGMASFPGLENHVEDAAPDCALNVCCPLPFQSQLLPDC